MSYNNYEYNAYEPESRMARIKIIGVGGGGGNAVNRMINAGITGVDFITVNTDVQALRRTKAKLQIQIGTKLTDGLGAGNDPVIGQKAAEESQKELSDAIADTDLLFIAAGMGGGTGTGAAPVIAKLAKEMGILTVAVVTKPFTYEGRVRMNNATNGIAELKQNVDTIVVVPNQKLIEVLDKNTSLSDALACADEMLRRGICAIVDIITTNSDINLDFADIKSVLKGKGVAHMGIGRASGENRVAEAVSQAVQSPLLETTIEGAKNVILSITSSKDIHMGDVDAIASAISSVIDPNAALIYGQTFDESMGDELKITIIASDFTGVLPSQVVETPVSNANVLPEGDIQVYERRVPQEYIEPQEEYIPNANVEDVVPEPIEKNNKTIIPQFMRNLFGKK